MVAQAIGDLLENARVRATDREEGQSASRPGRKSSLNARMSFGDLAISRFGDFIWRFCDLEIYLVILAIGACCGEPRCRPGDESDFLEAVVDRKIAK